MGCTYIQAYTHDSVSYDYLSAKAMAVNSWRDAPIPVHDAKHKVLGRPDHTLIYMQGSNSNETLCATIVQPDKYIAIVHNDNCTFHKTSAIGPQHA